jgi:hypothetical protein
VLLLQAGEAYAPFEGLDITTNYCLSMTLPPSSGGHLTQTGTGEDVAITKEFTVDVYQTLKRSITAWIKMRWVRKRPSRSATITPSFFSR